MSHSTKGFTRSGTGLIAAAFLAPFSATRLLGPVTFGRAVAIAVAALLAYDLWRLRLWPIRLDRLSLLAVSAYVGLFGWIAVNTLLWGCNCDGKLGGFAEVVLVGVIALLIVALEPRLRGPLIVALLAGTLLAAFLALTGVGSINSASVDMTRTGGRLSGTYGNANELGFVLALSLPIALAFLLGARGRGRIAPAVALAVLAVSLVLTYSRGGILAAALGCVAVGLWRARGSRRRLVATAAAAATAVVVAAVLYSIFEHHREQASFGSVPATLRPLDQRDLSGWDTRTLGPLRDGPAALSNRAIGIAIHTGYAVGGASIRWGEAAAGGTYVLQCRVRALDGRHVRIAYALGDPLHQGLGAVRVASVGTRWRQLELTWRPRLRAPHATLYLWRRAGSPAFAVNHVTVRAHAPKRELRIVRVPTQLKGSIFRHLTALSEQEEDRYVRSRLDAARLAIRAFRSQPLRGIGWGTFPEYANEHLDYGQLAAHDQYLSFAAELGLIGFLLLGLLVAAVIGGVRRAGSSTADAAAVGAIAAAGAGLVFVEALPVPQLSVPVAMVIAVLCARRTAPRR